MSADDESTTLRRADVSRLFAETSGAPAALAPGMALGEYVLVERLGQGGMGEVWRAVDRGRDVAIKVLSRELTDDEVSQARFEREVASLNALADLPGIASLLDAGKSADGRPYFVMEFVHGARSLGELLRLDLPRDAALDALEHVGAALGVAHERGLLHRDIKPSNILILPSGEGRLIDFGLAKVLGDESRRLTQTDEVMGTMAYMAPEQVLGEALGPWTDVFSLGATLYKVLTGVTPYEGDMVTLMQRAADREPVVPPSEIARERVPEELEAVCLRALRGRPEERFPDAGAFAAALRAARAQREGGDGAGWSARRALLGAALVAGAVTASLVLLRAPSEPERAEAPPRAGPSEPAAPLASPVRSETLAVQTQRVPAWFASRSRFDRPPLPLPVGLRFSSVAGEFVARDGSRLVWCRGARFRQGSEDGNADERPVRSVEVAGFFLGKLEVTWGQYLRFCRETGRPPPSNRIETYSVPFAATDAHPVFNVTWNDARAYCAWAGLRLPSESEWELGARGTNRAWRYPWGRTFRKQGPPVANVADRSVRGFVGPEWGRFEADYDDGSFFPAPVGSYPAGASPCGALDMAGNVWEWTSSPYRAYGRAPRGGERHRVARGGSWDNSAPYSRSTNRGRIDLDARKPYLGFRVACSPSRGR